MTLVVSVPVEVVDEIVTRRFVDVDKTRLVLVRVETTRLVDVLVSVPDVVVLIVRVSRFSVSGFLK